MTTYENNLITFLSHENTILLHNEAELFVLNELTNKIGLKLFTTNLILAYNEFLKLSKHFAKRTNKEYKLGDSIILEYDNHKGVCIGWCSIEESKDWFGIEPLDIKDITKQIENI